MSGEQPTLYQQTFDAILQQIGYRDWGDLEMLIARIAIGALILLVAAMIREAVHVRRQKEVLVQLRRWADALPFPFGALPLPQQLEAFTPLRRMSGHPAYVVHALVSLRLQLEEMDAGPALLATLDEIATQHMSKAISAISADRSNHSDSNHMSAGSGKADAGD
jgi:hypothetical protein